MLFLKMWKLSFGICAAKALEPKVFITPVPMRRYSCAIRFWIRTTH